MRASIENGALESSAHAHTLQFWTDIHEAALCRWWQSAFERTILSPSVRVMCVSNIRVPVCVCKVQPQPHRQRMYSGDVRRTMQWVRWQSPVRFGVSAVIRVTSPVSAFQLLHRVASRDECRFPVHSL